MTDASLIALSKTASLEHLSSLGLTDCSITDEGLKILLQKPLPALDDLGLGNTQITDSMVKDLAKLKSLKTLALPKPAVSDAAVSKLKEERPGMIIFHLE